MAAIELSKHLVYLLYFREVTKIQGQVICPQSVNS